MKAIVNRHDVSLTAMLALMLLLLLLLTYLGARSLQFDSTSWHAFTSVGWVS